MYVPSAQMIADMPRYEGKSLSVYADSLGNPTQGIGQHDGVHFGDSDITEDTMWNWLLSRLQIAYDDTLHFFPTLGTFNFIRKEALIQVLYNMGRNKFSQFVPFIEYINSAEWDAAAYHLLTNLKGHLTPYTLQVGARAEETALRICSGNVIKEFRV